MIGSFGEPMRSIVTTGMRKLVGETWIRTSVTARTPSPLCGSGTTARAEPGSSVIVLAPIALLDATVDVFAVGMVHGVEILFNGYQRRDRIG